MRLARELGLTGALAIASTLVCTSAIADSWSVSFDKSAMDDSQSVFLVTESVNPVPGTLEVNTVTPTLTIRCHENKTALYVNWQRYVTTGGIYSEEQVRYRIDDAPPKTATWNLSTDFEATGLWSGGSSIALIRQLIKAKRFLIEVTPYGSNTIRAEFDITGLDERIGDVQKACNWSTAATVAPIPKQQALQSKPAEPPDDYDLPATLLNSNPPPATGSAYSLPGSTPDEQYQYAFDLLRQTKYDEAEKALSTFVAEYPENPLAGNATYWLGETYFVRQDYNNAALTFAQGFQKYPKSGKAPDTLLKLGISLAALGETADACKALKELGNRFPTAADSIKQRAAREQSKNGCH